MTTKKPRKEIDEFGNEYWYNENGKLIHGKWSNGDEVWYEYDKKGNLIHEKYPNGDEFWYNENEKIIHKKCPNGTEYWFDKKGNKITEAEFNKIWEKK